jgi:hypothetical protein
MSDFDFLRTRLGLTSGPSLDLLRQRVAKAEADLETARAAMRAAADAAGIERDSLFSGSRYVLRTSGERWAREARIEGEHAALERSARAAEIGALMNASPKWRDAHLKVATLARGERSAADPVQEVQNRIARDRQTDLSRNREIGASDNPTDLAAAIHRAADRRRSPTDSDPAKPMDPLARAIVDSARKAHRKQED